MSQGRSERLQKSDAAFHQAMRNVIQRARQTGTPILIWKDGGMAEISPEEAEQRLEKSPAPKLTDKPDSP
jgi:hypothetical protein